MSKQKPAPGFDSLMEKARRFCVFRERCYHETLVKVKSWGIPYELVQKIMNQLQEEKFINDSRFAGVYARSKFNANQWGKIKIQAHLQALRISNQDIREALSQIDSEKYEAVAIKLAQKKSAALKPELDSYTRKAKIMAYLLQKGFEMEIIKRINEYVK